MFPSVPLGVPTWWFVLGVGLAVLVIGIAKAGFGGTVMVLAMPLIANAMPANRAIGVMLPLLMFADLLANIAHFNQYAGKYLRWILSGALVGIAAAAMMLAQLESTGDLAESLDLIVGSLCLLLVGYQFYRIAGGKLPPMPASPWAGRVSGGVAGVSSTLAHAGGPLVSLYLLEVGLNKRELVGTLVLFFGVVNLCKLPVYVTLGLVNSHTLLTAAWFSPLIPLGIALGLWLHKRIPEKPFMMVVYLGAAAGAAVMLVRAVA